MTWTRIVAWFDAPLLRGCWRHHWVRKAAGRRLYLVCLRCQKETPGVRI